MMVIGGAEVFRLALPQMNFIHLTRVHCQIEDGDTFMFEIPPAQWREVRREEHAADQRNAYAITFIELERIAAPTAR
jgi:dihydrofolate reductase